LSCTLTHCNQVSYQYATVICILPATWQFVPYRFYQFSFLFRALLKTYFSLTFEAFGLITVLTCRLHLCLLLCNSFTTNSIMLMVIMIYCKRKILRVSFCHTVMFRNVDKWGGKQPEAEVSIIVKCNKYWSSCGLNEWKMHELEDFAVYFTCKCIILFDCIKSLVKNVQWVSSFLTAHQHIKGYFVPSRLLRK